jgi:hypothetical protein
MTSVNRATGSRTPAEGGPRAGRSDEGHRFRDMTTSWTDECDLRVVRVVTGGIDTCHGADRRCPMMARYSSRRRSHQPRSGNRSPLEAQRRERCTLAADTQRSSGATLTREFILQPSHSRKHRPSESVPRVRALTIFSTRARVFALRTETRLLLCRLAPFSKEVVKMDAGEPRVRRRGFFLHSDTTGEVDTGEHENPEGFVVRVRIGRSGVSRRLTRLSATPGRSRPVAPADEVLPQIRSGSVTGSRQRARWHR